MPNRIIKESICTSESIEGLTWFEEVFFYRLIVTCDDYGRYDARPAILKSVMFPLKDGVSRSEIEEALSTLAAAGMVMLYEVSGRPYLQLCAWGDHQRLRNSREKYPAPQDTYKPADCGELPQNAAPAGADTEAETEAEAQSQSPSQNADRRPQKPGGVFAVFAGDTAVRVIEAGDGALPLRKQTAP